MNDLDEKIKKDTEEAIIRIKESEKYLDKIRGSLIGGAAGDALGYAIEFLTEEIIFSKNKKKGITEYELDPLSGKALISDDTQMTLFTANGILVGSTWAAMRGIGGVPHMYMQRSYNDWLKTQQMSFEESRSLSKGYYKEGISYYPCYESMNYCAECYSKNFCSKALLFHIVPLGLVFLV